MDRVFADGMSHRFLSARVFRRVPSPCEGEARERVRAAR